MDQIERDRIILENSVAIIELDTQIAHNNSIVSMLYAGLIEDAIDVLKDRNQELRKHREEKVNEIRNLEANSEVVS